jgi:hypothetical protein
MIAKPTDGLLVCLAAARAGNLDLGIIERAFGHDAFLWEKPRRIAWLHLRPPSSVAWLPFSMLCKPDSVGQYRKCGGAVPSRQCSYREEQGMRKVLRGYAKDRDGNLIQIGTIPLPNSKDKRSPRERQDKRHLIRQGATIFKKEIVR